MRKILLFSAFIAAFITLLSAADLPKPDSNRGRNYFRQTCKDCHTKNAVGGEVTPLSKTMAQWRRYFENGTHNRGKLTDVMSDEKLRDVRVTHAADSEQPETCGR